MNPSFLLPSAVLAVVFTAASAAAQTFTYSSGGDAGVDTLFNVRGRNAADVNDLGVNLGNVTQFLSSRADVLELPILDPADLAAVFGDLAELSFSVAAGANPADTSAGIAAGTVFITKPRTVPAGFVPEDEAIGTMPFANPSSTAPTSAAIITQGTLRNRITTIGNNLTTAFATPIDDQVARIPDSAGGSYTSQVGIGGNFGVAQTQGSVEGSTDGVPTAAVFLDFYRLNPASGAANVTYLGAFELDTDGTLDWYHRDYIVPEPSAGLLLATGGLAWWLRRRRAA
jgi:hypothetical protein